MKKKLLLLFVFFIAVMIVTIVFLPQMLAKGLEEALPHIGKSMNKNISVKSIDFAWSGRCELSELNITDADGNILKSDKAIADIGVMPIFSNQVLVNDLTLTGTTLVIRQKDGELNVSPPGDNEEKPEFPLPAINKEMEEWIRAAWNTLNDYLAIKKAKEKEESKKAPEDKSSPWRFGLDHLHCADLALILENEDKTQHRFRSSFTLNGCGSSSKPFMLDLSGPNDLKYQIKIIKDSLTVKNIPIKSKKPLKINSHGDFTIDGSGEMTLNWAKGQHEGKFKLLGISCKIHEKLAPLTDLVLGGHFKGKDSSLDWDVDNNFFNSIKEQASKALQSNLNSELNKRTEEAKKELEKKKNEALKKAEDKLKDKASDKFKDIFK